MTDGAITLPDAVLVRLGARVARLTPDPRPGWWRIDPATSVRRADAIEIRAAALAAAANGGGARLLAVLRAATLDGAATPLADAVMLALALGDTAAAPPPSGPSDDGWTRVRFGGAAEPALAEETGEAIAGWIEAMLARVLSNATDAEGSLPAGELPPGAHGRQRARRSPAPEDRPVAPVGQALADVQPGLADPRLRDPAQSSVHATLRHRRLVAKPAHDYPSPTDANKAPPPALDKPPGSGVEAAPTQTTQPTLSFPTIFSGLPRFSGLPWADFVPRPKSLPTLPDLELAGANGAPPSSFRAAPSRGRSAPPLAELASPGIATSSPALSWPVQTAPGPAPGPAFPGPAFPSPTSPVLPGADALLAALARALGDECDHRGLDR